MKRTIRFNSQVLPAWVWKSVFTREQLREIARIHGIPRGRNTDDTIRNISVATPLNLSLTLEVRR